MRNPAVDWSEGMFLCPQHFQAADRYWHEMLATRELFDHPFSYGIRSLKISAEALANSQVALSGLSARFRDGALFVLGDEEEWRVNLAESRPEGQTLAEALAERESVMLLLAAASPTSSSKLVAEEGAASHSRFVRFDRDTVDDSTGDNPQVVGHRKLNPKVLLETDDRSGYDTLPLFRVRRSAGSGQPEIDPDYFPPVLSTSAWPGLGMDIVRRVYDLVSARAESLSQQVRDRGVTFSSHEAGDLERMMLLQTLHEAIGNLTCLAFAEGVHPFPAYRALCQLVGRLSVFGETKSLDDPPRYDHDDLVRIFRWALRQIELLIYDPSGDAYQQRFFVGEGQGLQVALDAAWFDSGWEWYVGARPLNLEPDECRRLFSSGKIDWKLGSSDRVDFLYTQKAAGVDLSPVPTPRMLPSREGWVYFKIARDTPQWQRLKTTRSLGMRVNQKLIRDLRRLQGSRRLDLNVDGTGVSIEFAVFAVSPTAR